MPFTPNYNWETPDVGADFGSWGGIQNATIGEIDADLKALADTVTANALNVAKTNVNNTFTGTQSFAALTASGVVSASSFSGGGNGLTANSVPEAAVSGLTAALAGKSNVGHTHPTGDIAGLNTFIDATNASLAGKSNVGHTHTTGDIAGLNTALDGKSNIGHTHTPAEILGSPLGYDTPTTAGSRTAFLPAAIDSSSLTAINTSLTPVLEKLKALIADLKTRGVI